VFSSARLADWIARDAELLGEAILEQPLAGPQIAAADHLPDLVRDDLTQGAVDVPIRPAATERAY
jgi:hypothetical protein